MTAVLDAELERRVQAESRIAAAMVELEWHPGHRLLADGSPTGLTGQRWAQAREALAGLWSDVASYRAVIAEASRVRGRRTRPRESDVAELRRLLTEPVVEVGRQAVPLPERGLDGPSEIVQRVTLGELADRMDTAFREVSDVVVASHGAYETALARLSEIADRVAAIRRTAGELADGPADPILAGVAAPAQRLAVLEGRCVADPLSVDEGELAALDADVARRHADLAGLAAVREAWPARRADLDAALAGLDALHREEERLRRRALDRVAGPGPDAPTDRRPALRAGMRNLAGRSGWPRRAAALVELEAAVAEAARDVRAARDRAAERLERLAELRGRFDAYRARADRLRITEHDRITELGRRAGEELARRPCDLAAATRAVVAYQRAMTTPTAHAEDTP